MISYLRIKVKGDGERVLKSMDEDDGLEASTAHAHWSARGERPSLSQLYEALRKGHEPLYGFVGRSSARLVQPPARRFTERPWKPAGQVARRRSKRAASQSAMTTQHAAGSITTLGLAERAGKRWERESRGRTGGCPSQREYPAQ